MDSNKQPAQKDNEAQDVNEVDCWLDATGFEELAKPVQTQMNNYQCDTKFVANVEMSSPSKATRPGLLQPADVKASSRKSSQPVTRQQSYQISSPAKSSQPSANTPLNQLYIRVPKRKVEKRSQSPDVIELSPPLNVTRQIPVEEDGVYATVSFKHSKKLFLKFDKVHAFQISDGEIFNIELHSPK